MARSCRMALLLHETPDGGRHYDWMLEREPGGLLATYRVELRLDQLRDGDFSAEAIGDHRRAYLEFEGEISGGRGRVRRVAAGWCSSPRVQGAGMEVEVDWGAGPTRCMGRRLEREGSGEWWRFTVSAGSDVG